MLFALAWRNFWLQLHRFQVILVALIVGFAVLLTMIGTTSGMTQTLREKAARYFAGDVEVFSFSPNRRLDGVPIIERILQSVQGFHSLTRRTEYGGGDASLYFDGDFIRQRKFVGIDWTIEGTAFDSLDWVSGAPLRPGDEKGILISLATADRLHLRLGDELTVVLNTIRGQRNSLSMIVRGIFRDTSFFGYASYIDIQTMNRALGYSADAVTNVGAILNPEASSKEFGVALVKALNKELSTYPIIATRDQLTMAMSQKGSGKSLGVMTLDANLAQIEEILNSVAVVTWIVSGLFILILMIGVGNTYRMIVFERTPEIGTMRALGLTRPRLLGLFLLEAVLLGLVGVVVGTMVGFLFLWAVQVLDFSNNALALLFLSEGRLKPWVPLEPYMGATMALIFATLAGAWIPAQRAAKLRPVDALRVDE